MGALNADGVWKHRYFRQVFCFIACCQLFDRLGVINMVDRDKLVTLIAGSSKQRSLLMVGDGRQSVYDKKPQPYMPKTTEQHALVNLRLK